MINLLDCMLNALCLCIPIFKLGFLLILFLYSGLLVKTRLLIMKLIACNCDLPFCLWNPVSGIDAFLYSFQVECLVCTSFICPGEELLCSVRNCEGVYHLTCAKERFGASNLKKFKCPQHVRSN